MKSISSMVLVLKLFFFSRERKRQNPSALFSSLITTEKFNNISARANTPKSAPRYELLLHNTLSSAQRWFSIALFCMHMYICMYTLVCVSVSDSVSWCQSYKQWRCAHVYPVFSCIRMNEKYEKRKKKPCCA